MKTTKYFDFRRQQSDRREIQDEWIKRVISTPEVTEIQDDDRIKKWASIKEAGGRYLRVILLEDKQTVHNAFFARNFKERKL